MAFRRSRVRFPPAPPRSISKAVPGAAFLFLKIRNRADSHVHSDQTPYVGKPFRTRDAICQETVFGFNLGRLLGEIFPLPSFHRKPLDLVSLGQHRVLTTEVDIGGSHVGERLVIALVRRGRGTGTRLITERTPAPGESQRLTGRAVTHPKLRVDQGHSLDLAELNRIGFLDRSHGATGRSIWRGTWNSEFESVVTLALAVNETGPQGVVLHHQDPNTERWSTYPVRFTWTPCPFGGGRLWFVCPGRGAVRWPVIVAVGSSTAPRPPSLPAAFAGTSPTSPGSDTGTGGTRGSRSPCGSWREPSVNCLVARHGAGIGTWSGLSGLARR
jgi:hypothetical protein